MRDGLLSSGTVSALCAACMTLVSLSPSYTNPQHRERERVRERVNSHHKTASLKAIYFQTTVRPVLEFGNVLLSADENK